MKIDTQIIFNSNFELPAEYSFEFNSRIAHTERQTIIRNT